MAGVLSLPAMCVLKGGHPQAPIRGHSVPAALVTSSACVLTNTAASQRCSAADENALGQSVPSFMPRIRRTFHACAHDAHTTKVLEAGRAVGSGQDRFCASEPFPTHRRPARVYFGQVLEILSGPSPTSWPARRSSSSSAEPALVCARTVSIFSAERIDLYRARKALAWPVVRLGPTQTKSAGELGNECTASASWRGRCFSKRHWHLRATKIGNRREIKSPVTELANRCCDHRKH
jgi:hypothetical protein